MKKVNAKALYTAYNEKVEHGPRTAVELTMNEALSELEDAATEELFLKMLISMTDFLEEQKQLAFMAGYKAGGNAKADLGRGTGCSSKVELEVVA